MISEPPVRTRHDALGKSALELWLGRIGETRVNHAIQGESRSADVYFIEAAGHSRVAALGALERVAQGRVLFEVFRNPITEAELNSCIAKRIDLHARGFKAARREKRPASTVDETSLCLIVPSLSARLRAATGAKPLPDAPRGFVALVPILRTVVVVTGRLPRTRSTLLLRLLGRDRVHAEAVKELTALLRRSRDKAGERKALLHDTLEVVLKWYRARPADEPLTKREEEMRMSLDDWERRFRAEGKVEGKAEAIISVLDGRGIALSPTQRARVLACADEATLDAWIRVAGTTTSATALLASTAGTARRPAKRAPRSKPVMDAPLVARDSGATARAGRRRAAGR